MPYAGPGAGSRARAAVPAGEVHTQAEAANDLPAPGHRDSSDGAIENESTLADGTGTFETIVLEGDAITQTEEFVPEESVDSEIAALTERLGLRRRTKRTGAQRRCQRESPAANER